MFYSPTKEQCQAIYDMVRIASFAGERISPHDVAELGIHLQAPVTGWTEAVKVAPPGYLVKSVNDVHLLRDAKLANQTCWTLFRYWHDPSQWYTDNYAEMAHKWWTIFGYFIDTTFLTIAPYVDGVEGDNEYLAEPIIAMPQWELDQRYVSDVACLDVWDQLKDQHPELRHIKMVIGNIGVGNNYEKRWGQLVIDRGAILGYHGYIHCKREFPEPRRDPQDWTYHSGRWAQMEAAWGIKPTWALTEGGPYASAIEGWLSSACLSGDWTRVDQVWTGFIQDIKATPAYKAGRVRGPVAWFTSGANDWPTFETKAPELVKLAQRANELGWTSQPTPEPPPPDPVVHKGPRIQYNRTYHRVDSRATWEQYRAICKQAFTKQQTVGFSVDDAMIPTCLTNRTMIEWGDEYDPVALEVFRDNHYPGAVIQYKPLPLTGTYQIKDVVAELPHSSQTYPTRQMSQVTQLVIHHSAGNGDPWTFANYHVNTKGWPGIGYHYVVAADGRIWLCQYDTTTSYHCGLDNYRSLGICLVGSFERYLPGAIQIEAMDWLITKLLGQYPGRIVLGHRECTGAATACPGRVTELLGKYER